MSEENRIREHGVKPSEQSKNQEQTLKLNPHSTLGHNRTQTTLVGGERYHNCAILCCPGTKGERRIQSHNIKGKSIQEAQQWWIKFVEQGKQQKPITVEPPFNEPLFNEVLDITNDILRPGQKYSKMYGIELRYNEHNPEAQT